MAFDDVIQQIGEFGAYQRRIYFILCLPVIVCSFHKIGASFLGYNVNFRCMLSNETAHNATYYIPDDQMNTFFELSNNSKTVKACEFRPDFNITGIAEARISSDGKKHCKEYVYDRKVFKSTTTTEWDLVCDKSWLQSLSDSLLMVGVMLGSMIFGTLSDKFGRKPTFIVALIIQLIGGILVAISNDFRLYFLFRMIIGGSSSGVFLVAYVMGVEMVGPSKRRIAGVCYQLFWSLGYMTIAGIAYIFTSWRQLQIVITIPSIIFLIYWWLIPESARWLISKGRTQEANDLLQKASKVNGKEMSRDTLDRLLNQNTEVDKSSATEKASFLDLFRYSYLRTKIIILSLIWLVISGNYYGLSWKAATLSGDLYINHLISGFVEVPAYIFLILTLDRWGRKIILSGALSLAGFSLIASAYVPINYHFLHVTLFMIGKSATTAAYGLIYIFTVELIPTVVRNAGLGACSTSARIGGIIAPFVLRTEEISDSLPLIIFGVFALLSGALSTLLSETLNKKLPETIKDGEENEK